MTGREGSRRALAVDKHIDFAIVPSVRFAFGDVVADVVDKVYMCVAAEDLVERAAQEMQDGLTIRPGKIGGGAHGSEVRLALITVDGNAGKLTIWQRDTVTAHRVAHLREIVGADLMPEPSGTGVDQDDHLVLSQVQDLRGGLILNALDELDLKKVVAAAECAELGPRPRSNARSETHAGSAIGETAAFFAAFGI